MSKRPSANDSFTSIQILSAKAQSLWSKARARMETTNDVAKNKDLNLPPQKAKATVTIFDVRAITVVKVTLTVLLVATGALTLYTLRDKLFILVMAAFIALVMDPHVRRLERMKVPRGIGVLILYLTFLSIALFLVVSLIPIVATQIQDLARFMNQSADTFLSNPEVHFAFLPDNMNVYLSDWAQQVLQTMGIKDRAAALFQFGQNLSGVAQSSISFAVQVAGSLFNFLVNAVLILFLAFFIQMEREKIGDFIRVLLPREYRPYYDAKADAVHQKVSQWFQGQLILCLVIGVLVFIALFILGMPYAQTLALLAGFMEFIPYAGPIISALPAVFIALTQSGFGWALVVLAVYYAIQICENNLLVPLVMKHAVGLSPIAIMFGMLVGVSFPSVVHPVIGIILAVPTTAIITIFVQDFYMMRRRK